jgi:hypothetical protein
MIIFQSMMSYFSFEHDSQVDVWIVWQFMLLSHLNPLAGWIADQEGKFSPL